MDEATLLSGLDGDRALLRELVEVFLADLPCARTEVRCAVKARDVTLQLAPMLGVIAGDTDGIVPAVELTGLVTQ